MGNSSKSVFRIFLFGVLMMIVTSSVIMCVTGDCFQWVATAAAILVLYRVARGAER